MEIGCEGGGGGQMGFLGGGAGGWDHGAGNILLGVGVSRGIPNL